VDVGKVWVLDTETKGTGANMVPIEKTRAEPAPKPVRRRKKRSPEATRRQSKGAGPQSKPAQVTATPLPPGHVRKKGTGEIGRVQAVDPKAGTVTVMWLRRGAASTVPLSAVSRR
jgi:hypothetical protein